MRNLTKYHLTVLYNHWTLKREGSVQFTQVFRDLSREAAIQAASTLLNGTGASLSIHHKNGQVEEKRLFPHTTVLKKPLRKAPARRPKQNNDQPPSESI